jgi:hypothetical protein
MDTATTRRLGARSNNARVPVAHPPKRLIASMAALGIHTIAEIDKAMCGRDDHRHAR